MQNAEQLLVRLGEVYPAWLSVADLGAQSKMPAIEVETLLLELAQASRGIEVVVDDSGNLFRAPMPLLRIEGEGAEQVARCPSCQAAHKVGQRTREGAFTMIERVELFTNVTLEAREGRLLFDTDGEQYECGEPRDSFLACQCGVAMRVPEGIELGFF